MSEFSESPAPAASAQHPVQQRWLTQPGFLYALGLFIAGTAALAIGTTRTDAWLPETSPWLAPFFLAYGLFTISIGYLHPGVGYVSFDRVAQVASILVLGPVAAAAVNGLASLVWPLQRLRTGQSLQQVLAASLHNAGLMMLVILGAGELYVALAGPIPVQTLDLHTLALLLVLIAAMQLLNELLMTAGLRLSSASFRWQLHGFALAMEIGSAVAGVLVAVVLVRMEPAVVTLLLVTLGLGMIALNQFARMRNRLEALVDERTRVLHDRTLALEHLATRDQLTGLFNRRHAEDVLARLIADFHASGRPFSVALVDLDHFKAINDRHSHETGDAVLRRIADLLSAGCTGRTIVARHGGEEFLLCMPDLDAARAAELCETQRHRVASADWSALAPGLAVTLSAGVATMRPGFTRSTLLNHADAHLYRAKHAGRNRVLGD